MRAALEPIDAELLHQLAEPEAYPEDPSAVKGVKALQTHLSHVFLTRERVYKLAKAIELPFAHLGTRDQRDQNALTEVALNRRLAADVYLGVAPVLLGAKGYRVGRVSETLSDQQEVREHCVLMRRLPDGRDALSLLEKGELEPAHLESVARVLAALHARAGLGVPAPFTSVGWLERVEQPVRDNFGVLRELELSELGEARLARLERATAAWFARAAPRFEERRAQGRVVDGHGDVHLQHVWFERPDGDALLIDCIAFNERLRRIDSASEVAFLAMDLAYRGRVFLAERFLRAYARESDDFGLYGVVDYYASYRAVVRAKVAALATRDPQIGATQRRAAAVSADEHLRLAEDLLERGRRGGVVVMCGMVGSGKSTAAEVVADACRGVVISSDRTRKRLAGIAPAERAGAPPQRGIYDERQTEAVYEALLERAEPVVASRRVAVLDATFGRADRRWRARDWAERRGVPALLVETHCDPEVARARLVRRAAEGRDPSDAGVELYEWSRKRFESPEEWPRAAKLAVATEAPRWNDLLREIAARFC